MDPTTTSPPWSPGKRILFRFAFIYLVLYKFPFPLKEIPWAGETLIQPYKDLWDRLVPWAGKHLLGLNVKIRHGGSGDTTYSYVQLLCFLIIAVVATAVWTVLDRKRPEYTRLYEGLRTYIRFALAAAMLVYGAYKVIPSQFAHPFPSELVEPFGESSPMGLLWIFMGASSGYTIFAGAAEMISGVLLAFRRTSLLGALVSIGAMSHVVAINYSYDVTVKLYSSHLLAMGIFLILPDLRRLLDLFVLNRPVEAAAAHPPRMRFRRTALVAQAVLVAAYSGYLLHRSYEASKEEGNLLPRPPFYGVWTVEELETDGVARPPLLTDATRWRRVVIEYSDYVSLQRMDGSRSNYGLIVGKRRLTLTGLDDPTWRSSFAYQETQPGLLTLAGTMDGRKTRLTLRREEESSYRLISGFHDDTSTLPYGSGDSTDHSVQLFCFLVIALAVPILWAILDRKRLQYARLHEALRICVRFALAAAMITYGAGQVVKSQFPDPPLDRLLQPYGDASLMGLAWTFMGASRAYNIFAGTIEMIGGLLLTVRRTTLLGALVCLGALSNVVALNFFYDIPGTLYSSCLLAMAVFLIVPDLRRLIDMFVLGRRVEPVEIRPFFQRLRLRRGALVLRTLLVLAFTAYMLDISYQNRRIASPPLYGIWNVDEFEIDGQARPPLVTDRERWRRVIFPEPGTLAVQLMSDSRERYVLHLDKGVMSLGKRDDRKWQTTLSYAQPKPELLDLEGIMDGRKIRARLHLEKPPKFLLTTRGFHWIIERSLGR
ncbi:MAG: hypothetical protein WAM82_04290 [Thermoanaerobaculia bacterium]